MVEYPFLASLEAFEISKKTFSESIYACNVFTRGSSIKYFFDLVQALPFSSMFTFRVADRSVLVALPPRAFFVHLAPLVA
jgi:hypothetical protein